MKIRDALAQIGSRGIERLQQRFDAWQNRVTGFGTSRDKTSYTSFLGIDYLGDDQLSNLYHGDDLAARMVDVVPDEMLREGFLVDLGDEGLTREIAEALDNLGVDDKFANAIRWARLFGGGALLIGADDGRAASQPLVPERAKGVSYLYELDRRLLYPLTWYTEPGHSKLGQVETYMVAPATMRGDFESAIVHESRLIVFEGTPTGIRERQLNLGWGFSVLQRAFEALRAFNTGWKAVEVLLTDGNQAVFKMQGLAEMIGSGGTELAQQRLQVIDLYRSVMRAIVVDAGDKDSGVGAESFERHGVSFSDIPNTLDKFMLRLASAVQIPVTILMGQSPAGMNATGESDFRWFYDRIRSEQTRKLAPKIRRLVRVMLATKNYRANPENITVKFPPLWTEPPLTAAQTRQTIAATDKLRIESGELLPEEVALQRGKPDGYDNDIVLTPEAIRVREAVVKGEYVSLTPDPTKQADVPDIELAPTDAATVIKVNEARAALNLPPLEGEDGELTLAEFKTKSAPTSGFGGPPGDPTEQSEPPGLPEE